MRRQFAGSAIHAVVQQQFFSSYTIWRSFFFSSVAPDEAPNGVIQVVDSFCRLPANPP
jgi:hypothetical protein